MTRDTGIRLGEFEMQRAGGCGIKWSETQPWRRTATTYHPHAPRGVSWCGICGRLVLRCGRWWADS